MADAERSLQRAIVEARRGGQNRSEALALAYLAGSSAYGPRPVPGCIQLCEDILERAGSNPWVVSGTRAGLARLRAMVGAFDDAERDAAEALRILDDLGIEQIRAGVEIELAFFVDLPRGDLADAEQRLRVARGLLRERGEHAAAADAGGVLARCAYAGGDYELANQLAREAAEFEGGGNLIHGTLVRGVRAMALARCGQTEHAEQLARSAVDDIGSTDAITFHAQALIDLGEVLTISGESREARFVIDSALALHERKGNLVGAAEARARLLSLSGRQ